MHSGRIAELGLATIAVGSVLAFGGVQSTAFSLVQVAAMLLAALVFWKTGKPELPRPTLAVLSVVLVIPLLQLVPLPRSVLGLVSPMRLALQEQLLGPLNLALAATPIAVNPHATLLGFFKMASYAMVFVLGHQACKRHSGSSLLAYVLVGIGLFEAVYGMVQYLTGWHYIFTYAKRYGTDAATGTYINRNHYAGLLEMVLPFILAGIWFRLPGRDRAARGIWRHLVNSPVTARWTARVLLVVVVFLGVVFSKSRMGVAAALVGVMVVMAIALLQVGRRSGLAVALLVLALPAVYGTWIGLAPVLERFELLGRPGALEQDRLPIWRDTLALIRDYPVLGTGLGTYRWASLHYQTQWFEFVFDHAHNDYLEFAADIGIPATVLLFGSLWVLVVNVARRALVLERTKEKILAAGCAGALAALLTHSLTDFNLQIPANALIFAWIAGTAAALSGMAVDRPLRVPAVDV